MPSWNRPTGPPGCRWCFSNSCRDNPFRMQLGAVTREVPARRARPGAGGDRHAGRVFHRARHGGGGRQGGPQSLHRGLAQVDRNARSGSPADAVRGPARGAGGDPRPSGALGELGPGGPVHISCGRGRRATSPCHRPDLPRPRPISKRCSGTPSAPVVIRRNTAPIWLGSRMATSPNWRAAGLPSSNRRPDRPPRRHPSQPSSTGSCSPASPRRYRNCRPRPARSVSVNTSGPRATRRRRSPSSPAAPGGSDRWSSVALAEDAALEGCQVFFGAPCVLLAIDEQLSPLPASTDQWQRRDMPRVRYAGRFDPEQIPMFTPELRRRDDIAGYAASDGPKAAAIHPWGRRLFVVRGAASQRAAEQEALAACNADPTRKGENGPCFLYAAGDQVVLPQRSLEPLTAAAATPVGRRLRTRSRVASARRWRCWAARTMSPRPMRAPPPTRPLRFRPRPAGPTVGAACPAGSSPRTARWSCASSALERRACCSPPTASCWRPIRGARRDGTCRGCIMTAPTCRSRCRST